MTIPIGSFRTQSHSFFYANQVPYFGFNVKWCDLFPNLPHLPEANSRINWLLTPYSATSQVLGQRWSPELKCWGRAARPVIWTPQGRLAGEYGATVELRLRRENLKTLWIFTPIPLPSPRTLHEVTWDWTRSWIRINLFLSCLATFLHYTVT
jgi:hypothetical protein